MLVCLVGISLSASAQVNEFEEAYKAFRQQALKEYSDFRDKVNKEYADFMRMVEKRDIPYKSESRLALEKLRKALSKERNTSLEESLATIDKGLKDDKMSNLETFRKEIIESINTNIVLRYAYAEGVIANSLKDDEEVIEAVKLLENNKEYHRILTEQDTMRSNKAAAR